MINTEITTRVCVYLCVYAEHVYENMKTTIFVDTDKILIAALIRTNKVYQVWYVALICMFPSFIGIYKKNMVENKKFNRLTMPLSMPLYGD